MSEIDENVVRMQRAIVELLKYAIQNLYRLPIDELRIADPSLAEIARLCALFNNVVEGTDIDGHFIEAIHTLREASDAVIENAPERLTDCAYHLEDFLQRQQQ